MTKKLLLCTATALSLLGTAPMADAARLSVDLDDGRVRLSERGYDRDHWRYRDHDRYDRRYDRDREDRARLISKSTRTIREPDGDRVIITRRVYQERDGDRFVRETRERIDR
jgi:hypothetical protein